jgi:serine/threonine protein kinase
MPFWTHNKIGEGTYGTVYSINYACPNFGAKKGYISKMITWGGVAEDELKILKAVREIDPEQKYLATFETQCKPQKYTNWLWYSRNIIMKNRGVSLDSSQYKHNKSVEHVIGTLLKQTLNGLSLMHNNGLYHRDIAIRNIVYDKNENRYRFIDFGLSLTKRQFDENMSQKNLKKDFEKYVDDNVSRGDGRNLYAFPDTEFIKYINISETWDFKSNKIKKYLNLNVEELREEIKLAQEDADLTMLFGVALEIMMDNNKISEKVIDDEITKLDEIIGEFYVVNSKMHIVDWAIKKLF